MCPIIKIMAVKEWLIEFTDDVDKINNPNMIGYYVSQYITKNGIGNKN